MRNEINHRMEQAKAIGSNHHLLLRIISHLTLKQNVSNDRICDLIPVFFHHMVQKQPWRIRLDEA